jgi:hypothetical protein
MEAAAIRPLGLETTGLSRPHSLDDLAALRAPQLLELYRSAEVPTVPELDGDLRGCMLAVRGSGRIWLALLRAFAAWRHFPWRGKSFSARTIATRGDGINRVFGDDEVRQVAPGLYLGQAYVMLSCAPRLALYFALQR